MNKKDDFYIIGVGASAGGLEALQRMFAVIPRNLNAAFIIIQHITQEYKGLTREILGRNTDLHVTDAKEGQKMERGTVYFTPPYKTLHVLDGHFHLEAQENRESIYQPIDIMLTSLGKADGKRSIGIILSGTGTDGSRGIRFIKDGGGMVISQNPTTAQFNGMPLMAIASGYTDNILSPEEMGTHLEHYIAHPWQEERLPKLDLKKEDDALQAIVELLSAYSNVDFDCYKIASLVRRIEKRMQTKEMEIAMEYLNYIKHNSDEIAVLYASILIGVTSFFRDAEAFDAISNTVLPEICKGKKSYETIRIWVPACSTGEEAYSVAMLMEEYIAENKLHLEYKIFATDLDPKAIEFAGIGRYTSKIKEEVGVVRLEKHFVQNGDFYDIKKSIRKNVIFVRHNVLRDPPFIRLDLITCRNLFIYLKTDAQKKLLWDFHYSLKTDAFLVLGQNESLEEPDKLFHKVDAKWKIYSNKADGAYKPAISREYIPSHYREQPPMAHHTGHPLAMTLKNESYSELLADKYAPTCIIINEANDLVYTNGNIDKYLHIPSKRTTLNVFKMVNKDLVLILRNGMRKVNLDPNDVVFKEISFPNNGIANYVNLYFKKLPSPSANPRSEIKETLILIEFEEVQAKVSKPVVVEEIADNNFSQEQIEDLERELELTKKELQYTVQENETINEELQASNEEMTSANEELQSTNEELQSSNEELFSVNLELKTKVDELTVLNNDINNLFKSTDIAIIFLDQQLNIRKFTPAVKEHLNLLDSDIGRPISHLTTKFTYNTIVADATKVLDSLIPFEKEIQNNNHGYYLMRIVPYKTEDMNIMGVVISFINVTELKKQNEDIQNKNKKLKRMNEYLDDFVYTVAHDVRAPVANMLSFLELIKDAKDPKEKISYIANLDNLVHRMDNTMRGLIEIIDAQNNIDKLVKRVSFADTFAKVKMEFKEQLDAAEALIELDFQVPDIRYIEAYLTTIFRNLLSNALKYKAEKRKLVIKVSNRAEENYVLMAFEDNGTGIDMIKHGHQLFKPFKRINKTPEGKGIGLHLIKTILEKNDGGIEVESAPNKGTRFKLKLMPYSRKNEQQ